MKEEQREAEETLMIGNHQKLLNVERSCALILVSLCLSAVLSLKGKKPRMQKSLRRRLQSSQQRYVKLLMLFKSWWSCYYKQGWLVDHLQSTNSVSVFFFAYFFSNTGISIPVILLDARRLEHQLLSSQRRAGLNFSSNRVAKALYLRQFKPNELNN